MFGCEFCNSFVEEGEKLFRNSSGRLSEVGKPSKSETHSSAVASTSMIGSKQSNSAIVTTAAAAAATEMKSMDSSAADIPWTTSLTSTFFKKSPSNENAIGIMPTTKILTEDAVVGPSLSTKIDTIRRIMKSIVIDDHSPSASASASASQSSKRHSNKSIKTNKNNTNSKSQAIKSQKTIIDELPNEIKNKKSSSSSSTTTTPPFKLDTAAASASYSNVTASDSPIFKNACNCGGTDCGGIDTIPELEYHEILDDFQLYSESFAVICCGVDRNSATAISIAARESAVNDVFPPYPIDVGGDEPWHTKTVINYRKYMIKKMATSVRTTIVTDVTNTVIDEHTQCIINFARTLEMKIFSQANSFDHYCKLIAEKCISMRYVMELI